MSTKNILIYLIIGSYLALMETKATTSEEPPNHPEAKPEVDSTSGPESNPDYFRFEILSSRDSVRFFVDEKEVLNLETKKNLKTDYANTTNGLHVVAVNPHSGKAVIKRKFATEMFAEGLGIPPLLSTLRSREVVILAVQYDGGLNLSKDIRRLFRSLGSLSAYKAAYRCYFVWVFVNGGKTLVEGIIEDNPTVAGNFVTSPLYVDVLVARDNKPSCWSQSVDETGLRRDKFCFQYGGYGNLCNCDSPINLDFKTPKLKGSVIRHVPILILASNRPQSLFKCLLTLLNQPGGHRENILVIVDGRHEEVESLLELMEIPFLINPTEAQTFPSVGARISYNYNFSLNATMSRFPNSDFLIVLEEDILASPNLISFFNQTSALLASDPTLYCVNAWNDLSAMHTGGNPHTLHRTETQPACGWMITRRFFEEIDVMWPAVQKDFDWDIWFRRRAIRGSRECLVPEVSRSFHMGEAGVHIKGQMTFAHFMGHLTVEKQDIEIHNLDRLYQQEYEEDLYSRLESDQVVFLNTTLHPCNSKFMPRNYTEKTVVIFFSMETLVDLRGWNRVASCLGLFNMDTRNQHYGLFRFYFYGTEIFAIGYPFSHYSYFKPSFVTPVSPEMTVWDTQNFGQATLLNRRRFRVPSLEKRLPYDLLLEKPVAIPIFYSV